MYTIKQNSFNEFIVKNSKFISLSFKVDSINEVTDILNSIKLEYEHATHYTYAYLIDGFCKYDDDNEPSKTSGFQILDLLEKRQLNHILCVVVRYFGGIKLGVGGLSRAYRKAANDVLLKSGIIELVEAYKEIKQDKGGRKTIDRQFEYNTYIRDFFEHNPGRSLDEAIRCWKYKKSQPGSNKYEDSDLTKSIMM